MNDFSIMSVTIADGVVSKIMEERKQLEKQTFVNSLLHNMIDMKKRNCNLEIWRFIACIIILLYHSYTLGLED